MAITFSNVGGAEPSTITFRAATVAMARGSTTESQEIIVLGDPQTSNGVARVLAAAPASTEYGLAVRVVSGPSSAADLPVQISGNSTVIQGTSPWVVSVNSRVNIGSTAADNAVVISGNSTVMQGTSPWVVGGNSSIRANLSSTATDNPVTATQAGTWNIGTVTTVTGVSSVAGVVAISGNSTVIQGTSPWIVSVNSRVNIGSTAADNAVAISGNSTVVQGTSPWVVSEAMNSSAAPSSNSSGVIVRVVVDNILTTASTNAFGTSTSFSIQSSGANLRSYVTAYSILSTNAGPHRIKFYSGATMVWPMTFAAVSSAVSGANLAVSAPGYLFRTNASDALTLQLGSGASSIAGYQVAVSYFRAP